MRGTFLWDRLLFSRPSYYHSLELCMVVRPIHWTLLSVSVTILHNHITYSWLVHDSYIQLVWCKCVNVLMC